MSEAEHAGVWINRTEIKSATSTRIYIVAQHSIKRHWACSCPGWKSHKKCKHLASMGLPNYEQPYEPFEVEKSKPKGFLEGYRHYDGNETAGSPEEWKASFRQTIGVDEAREILGLGALSHSASLDWHKIQHACSQVLPACIAVLFRDYEDAASEVAHSKLTQAHVARLKTAKFRLDALLEYLAQQKVSLEQSVAKVSQQLKENLQ